MFGIAFGGRRQSRDRELCADILKDSAGKRLSMSEYSAKLFPDSDVFVADSPSGDIDEVYFLELRDPGEYLHLAKQVIVYRWNRHYPSDIVFSKKLEDFGFRLSESCDICGYSHEKITKETYNKYEE